MAERYRPIVWAPDSTLSPEERRLVECQRRDLWETGVRKEPLLTEMAFCFAAVLAAAKR